MDGVCEGPRYIPGAGPNYTKRIRFVYRSHPYPTTSAQIMSTRSIALRLVLLATAGLALQTPSQEPLQGPTVPADLRPLLTAPESVMRIVRDRYDTDWAELDRFHGTALSTFHLARLKRFDLDWLEALDGLDVRALSAEARGDLQELQSTIREDVVDLDASAAVNAQLRPLAPFADEILVLMDARRRLDPMDAQAAAGVIHGIGKQIPELRAAINAGNGPSIATLEIAHGAADVVEALQGELQRWFNFYDGYDPLFTWWMAVPYEETNQAMETYAGFLRDREVPGIAEATAVAPNVTLAPAPRPALSDVPDLAVLLALPQNEMRGVAQAFRGGGRGRRGAGNRRGGRGNRAGGNRRGQGGRRRGGGGGRGRGRGGARTEGFYTDWLAALETIDFDGMSRPAQVSYLRLRHEIEVALLRMRTPAQENIPRRPDDSGIEGRPIGRTGLVLDLANEMIPYTPEEMIAIGDAEYAWCMEEMLKAAEELGYGRDWPAALEHVKTLHVPAGGQPVMIRGLMFEAVDFLREHDLITVPQVASEALRMGMMSPRRQLVNPFFTGGAQISVSYPTDTMAHQAKLQSMRGNNIPMARATVHHELIPGHNLSGFINRRFSSYQAGGGNTPFYSEGWAVYWEMLLYGMDFPRIAAERTGFPVDAENRIGFLFWRMFRSARITFSLRFHMGEWSAQESIDFLVAGVGHERENAIAEVRRSFAGSYGPLYQAAYLMGAVQFRKLHEELVESGKMAAKDFHDAILRNGNMPVALVRLLLNDEELTRDMSLDWKYYGETISTRR